MLKALTPQTNRGRETMMALLFASPWFVGMAILVTGPFFMALYYSFTDFKIMGNTQWVGLENYRQLIDDDRFIKSLKNTAYFTILSIPLSLICSLAVALLVHRPFRGSTLARTTIYLPSLFGGVFVAALASQVFSGNYGLANKLLQVSPHSGATMACVARMVQANLCHTRPLGDRGRVWCSSWQRFNLFQCISSRQQSSTERIRFNVSGTSPCRCSRRRFSFRRSFS